MPDLKLTTVLVLLQALRILCHLWAKCGAAFVKSKEETENNGEPKLARQCHLSVAMKYHSFVTRHLMAHPGSPGDRVRWVLDFDRCTRAKARAYFQAGWLWGEALFKAVTKDVDLLWRTTGVGVSKALPEPIETQPTEMSPDHEPPLRRSVLKRPSLAPLIRRRKGEAKDLRRHLHHAALICSPVT